MWKIVKGPAKWLIVIPGLIIGGLIYTGMSSPQAAVTGYGNGARAAAFGTGVATYTIPEMAKEFVEGGKYVKNDANGKSTVGNSAQAKADGTRAALSAEEAKLLKEWKAEKKAVAKKAAEKKAAAKKKAAEKKPDKP